MDAETSVTGRVALVTGAGSADGIGFACARRLSRAGYAVVVASTTARIFDRVAELEGVGGRASGMVGDLTDPAQADALVRLTQDTFGRLDVVVNNAGMGSVAEPDSPASILEEDDESWRRSLARNLDPPFHVSRAALRLMIAQGYGRIVNISSLSGPVTAFRGDVAYHAAKAAIVGLTRSTALDVAGMGITANAVAPGWIATAAASDFENEQGRATPIGRSGTPDEVAALVEFVASPAASYLTGQIIVVDGGNSINEVRGPGPAPAGGTA